MKSIYNEFINGLEVKYLNSDEKLKDDYKSFMEKKKGISNEELDDLIKEFPDIPKSLIELLKYSNGTDIYCFQSDVDDGKYPYYLIKSTEMIAEKDAAQNYYGDYISREFDDDEIDSKITNDVDNVKWLLFSNCMNNGGTSQLFIDFTPSKEGKVGQIVRYLHDPDSIIVIADSFDDFLKQIIDSNYKFVDSEMETIEDNNKNHELENKIPKPIFYGVIVLSLINFFYNLISILNNDSSNLIYIQLLVIISLIPAFLSMGVLSIKNNNKILKSYVEIIKILLVFVSLVYLIKFEGISIILLLLNVLLIILLFTNVKINNSNNIEKININNLIKKD